MVRGRTGSNGSGDSSSMDSSSNNPINSSSMSSTAVSSTQVGGGGSTNLISSNVSSVSVVSSGSSSTTSSASTLLHHHHHQVQSQQQIHNSGHSSSSNLGMNVKVLPADHIMFKLLGDFKDHTKVKIDIFIRDDKIRIEDFFEGPESKTFHQVIEGLTEVSKYFLNLIAAALLQWRSSQHVIPAKSISKPKMDDINTKRDITPMVDERYKLIVEYILCTSLLSILGSLTKENLNDTIANQIESICFDNFKLERRLGNSSPLIIPDLCASILGQLSKYRLKSLSSRFFKEFQLCFSSSNLKSKTFPILQGIRYFKVKISSVSKLKQSHEFLASYLELFKNPRIKGDLRRATAEILASILRPLTEEKFKPELNYTDWLGTIRELYDIISKKTKKTRNMITSYPLMSILLCCSDKETFLKYYWGLMESFLKNKEKTIRPYCLESVQYLLECYLTKYSEQPEEVYERLHQLVSYVFPPGHSKRLTLSASDSLDIFVDIICVIANTRIDFAFEKIIFELLRGGEPKEYITNPERMIIGLRAVMLIDQAGTNPLTPKMLSFTHSPSQSPSTSPIPDPVVNSSNKARAVRRQRYGTLNIKKVTSTSLIEPYLKNISNFLSSILLALDPTFGSMLTSNQTKSLNELLEKARPPGNSCLDLLKIAISVIPIAFPLRIPVHDLVTMLSKQLIHLDRGVCEKSSIVLTQLMASRPDIRSQIINGLGRNVLTTLHDKQPALISVILEKLRELLDSWARSKNGKFSLSSIEDADEPKFKQDTSDVNPPDRAQVEPVAIVFLCSSSGRVRKICLSILESIRTVCESFIQARVQAGDEDIEISTYIKDIIDENGNDYLYRAQNFFLSSQQQQQQQQMPNGGNQPGQQQIQQNQNPDTNKFYKRQRSPQDFERILESESREDQILWTACLADITKTACELCPMSIHKASELILLRIKPIQPDESVKNQSSISPEQEALWVLWRNYIVFSCITIQIPDSTSVDVKSRLVKQAQLGYPPALSGGSSSQSDLLEMLAPSSARELFNLIIPYLKSMDKFFAESALMALEKTNPNVLEVLFDVLKPFEHELHNKKTSKKKSDIIKSVIGIRRHCLESLRHGELVRREMLKKSYFEFIQEILSFLQTFESNEYLWDGLHYIRFNFCAMIHRIVQQLYLGGHEFLDKIHRRELFKCFSKWSESEEFLREDGTIRRFISFSQQEEKEAQKRKDIEYRTQEHASQLASVATHAVSATLLGPYFIDTFRDPSGVIFQWINNMFQLRTKMRSVTRLALENFLKHNLTHQELIYHCVNQCYSTNFHVANGYFLSLVELSQDQILKFEYSDSIMTNLIILNTGSRLSSVRQQSLQLLSLIKSTKSNPPEAYNDTYYPSAIGSDIPETYINSQYQLSEKLSLENPELCYEIFLDIVYRLEVIQPDYQKQMLNYVKPWVKQMHLSNKAPKHPLLEPVLQGLILISRKYSDNHSHLIEDIWRILGRNEENIGVIIEFILGIVERTRNHDLIPVFKRICIFLGRSSPQKLINCLVNEISSTTTETQQTLIDYGDIKTLSKAQNSIKFNRLPNSNQSSPQNQLNPQMGPPSGAGSGGGGHEYVHYNTISSISHEFQIATELHNANPALKSSLNRSQLPLIFLSEVAFEIGEEFRIHLPSLLQLIFLGLYYNHQHVHEHCRLLLLNLIRCLVIKKFQLQEGGTIDNPIYDDAIQLVDSLLPSVYRIDENASSGSLKELAMAANKKDISNPKYVVTLSKRVVFVLSDGSPELKEHWGSTALYYAINSPNQRLAMRSYQIIRGLEPTSTIDSLTEVMQSLGKYLQNLSPENAILVSEILETLQVMVKCIHPSKLILFPQIFWGTMAILHTEFEQHFIGAIKLLSLLLDIVNFSDRAVQNVFLASLPKEWENFRGLQPLIINGLMSPNTAQISVEFLSKITLQPCDELFHPDPVRFITNLVALLPYLCITIGEPTYLSIETAEHISELAENMGLTRLSTIFNNYSHEVYYCQFDQFLQDLSPPLCESVIKNSTLVFSLLFNMLEFGPSEYQYPILKILTALVKGGVNPADTRSSRVADWYDTVTQLINDHKSPHYNVSQAIRFIEITSGNSPTNLVAIENASMKPSRSTGIVKKFTNKVDRGTLLSASYLLKVLDSCAKSATSSQLAKSMYSTTQIFETFFSTQDEPQKIYDSNIDDFISDNDATTSSIGHNPSSDIDNDNTDTLRSNDFEPNLEFHNFPHFQGFNDILEGLGDMNDDIPSNPSSRSNSLNSNPLAHAVSNADLLKSPSGSTSSISSQGTNPTPISLGAGSGSSGNLLAGLSTQPTSPTTLSGGQNRKSVQSSSPTLSRNMQFHTNSALTTLSYNVTAAKSWWNSCSEQIEFTSEKDLFDVFTAAYQLIQHITIEYKTLFNQCLPLIISIASEVSALTVDIFEKPNFVRSATEVHNTQSLAERYKKHLENYIAHQQQPNTSTFKANSPTQTHNVKSPFLEQREKGIANFTNYLNIYTEQRTLTNNTRAKLFENGISSDELQIQTAETRFSYAVCNLYQHLLQLWQAYISLEELLLDFVPNQDLLPIEKQREDVKKELNKCKVLAVRFKEKESDLLSKSLQVLNSSSNSNNNNNSPLSPTLSAVPSHALNPIGTSPTSLSSPSLLDESHRISVNTEKKRSNTHSNERK
ncbi:hypothetical protein DLAC_07330 [Tieghemostelium lacteum]|uniref:Uncharacterized protein n=1 Tax=Tieghemostelium lacteum TaxID=361077 RepID=A0A151ZC86_TIELA|nr:hypothetical protein DLAC_07330 [Tieghemostelium lacteum]|eukprot:KYQ91563.1 hypothetical protein DLAC_07330 [Tieghemostelium lacteum]